MNRSNPALVKHFFSVISVGQTEDITIPGMINRIGFLILLFLLVLQFACRFEMVAATSSTVITNICGYYLLGIFCMSWSRLLICKLDVLDDFYPAFCASGGAVPVAKPRCIFKNFTQPGVDNIKRFNLKNLIFSMADNSTKSSGATPLLIRSGERILKESRDTSDLSVLLRREHCILKSSISSRVNKGRKNRVMPCVRGEESDSSDNESVTISKEYTPSILVVEDCADIRSPLVKMLRVKYIVYEAANGVEAQAILENTDKIDLVLSDLLMPEMDGYNLLRWIKRNENFSGIPVIFITGMTDSATKIECLNLGAIDYITKPFNCEELLLRIRNQLELVILRNSAVKKYNRILEQLKNVNSRNISEESAIKIETICVFIKGHYTQVFSRDDLARASGMNPDTFSRLFNQYTGKTLNDYIYELRIANASRRLIETEDTVIRIAFDTGFDSIRTFNRIFKKITGVTPGEFRGRG